MPAHIRVVVYNFTFALVSMRLRNPSRTCVIGGPRTIESRTEMYVKESIWREIAKLQRMLDKIRNAEILAV